MAEKIAFENNQISNFEGLVTLTLDQSYCIPSCITHQPLRTCQISFEIEETFCGRTPDGRTDGHLRPALLVRLCLRVDLKISPIQD